ncbi:MAG: AMP-binding protein [Candidatus Obscuribacterales bacterium]|nr:AMP-binding protein [Candidatus Obscuribacterales bacterium]
MTQQEPASASSAQIVPERPLPSLPSHWNNLASAFVHQARAHGDVQAVADSSGVRLTYAEVFEKAMALSRVIGREFADSEYVPILLPPSVGAVIVNVAVSLLGKVPCNLNYTGKQPVVDSSLARLGVTKCISTEEVLERFGLNLPGALEVKSLKDKVTTFDKGKVFAAKYMPLTMLGSMLPGLRRTLDQTATIIFTSGSTGEGKGVVLSNRNVLSNILQIREHANIGDDSVVLGILPFFHSLGYTVTMWAVLALGWEGVYHSNPLEAQKVGELMQEYGVTIMANTPTLMRSFLRRCSKEHFATVRWLLLGSEKMPPKLADDVEEKLGIRPLEGYGTTEMTPVVAANVPHQIKLPDGRVINGSKLGSAGRLLPGTRAKTTDPLTGAELAPGKEGLLHYSGPQVFQCYLNLPEQTAKVLGAGGWYCSGDIGYVDEDGFLFITGRWSRFAKIGGEMVPLMKVEELIRQVTKAADESSVHALSLPDEKKGEKVAIAYTPALGHEPKQVCDLLNATDTSKLWIPSASEFVLVDAFPVGATGKLDQVALKKIVQERLAAK